MKIGRAYKHVKEFDALVVAHCTRKDLFTATGREENGRYIVRVEYQFSHRDRKHQGHRLRPDYSRQGGFWEVLPCPSVLACYSAISDVSLLTHCGQMIYVENPA